MGLYRKKPVVVEAFRWTGDQNQTDDPVWIVDAIREGRVWFKEDGGGTVRMWIQTWEGPLCASLGDWVIKSTKGALYPLRNEDFRETYEAVDAA